MRQILKKLSTVASILVLSTVTPFAFADEDVSLKKGCVKDYPLVNGETDRDLLSLYAQLCDKKNKKNHELKTNLLIQAASRYQELGKSYKALQLVEELNAQNIKSSSLTDTRFLAGIAIADAALAHMRQEELRYLSAELTYPPAKALSSNIQKSLPAPDTTEVKAAAPRTSKKSTRKTTSTRQTVKKSTTPAVKSKKVEKVQPTKVAAQPSANPFNSL